LVCWIANRLMFMLRKNELFTKIRTMVSEFNMGGLFVLYTAAGGWRQSKASHV
jgi:hypothetical protein